MNHYQSVLKCAQNGVESVLVFYSSGVAASIKAALP